MIFERILILGCGLIGSSLAASARECGLAREIVGVDNKYELMRERNPFFDEITGSLKSFEEADLCVIAIPIEGVPAVVKELADNCLLYTSPSPRDATLSRMPSSA